MTLRNIVHFSETSLEYPNYLNNQWAGSLGSLGKTTMFINIVKYHLGPMIVKIRFDYRNSLISILQFSAKRIA